MILTFNDNHPLVKQPDAVHRRVTNVNHPGKCVACGVGVGEALGAGFQGDRGGGVQGGVWKSGMVRWQAQWKKSFAVRHQ
ncbi:hypothetical protein MLD38_022160 [Melastoma candidum]|uniref:Uncharacterized protein n=1 Tax=Melastoma candidum TaxID=119954 RepID=A0ACB9QIE0_9MYRT|nr:hypothetical protein MLD38_022160 [Melastoma candidum]